MKFSSLGCLALGVSLLLGGDRLAAQSAQLSPGQDGSFACRP
jgi:hypothetical protein